MPLNDFSEIILPKSSNHFERLARGFLDFVGTLNFGFLLETSKIQRDSEGYPKRILFKK